MSTQSPLLSVTVLNYNYGHYLPICLDSILKQTFTNFELILINDKSTDNSLDIIRPYLADSRVRLVDHTENKGFMRSLIEGADLSRAPYITVISADDWILDPTAFEKQIEMIEGDPEIAFAFTDYGCYTSNETCTYLMHPAPEASRHLRISSSRAHRFTAAQSSARPATRRSAATIPRPSTPSTQRCGQDCALWAR
jgi:glycosyltransferase involved in cell wall biosynthesis